MPAVHILYVATLYKWVQGYFLYISTRCIGSLSTKLGGVGCTGYIFAVQTGIVSICIDYKYSKRVDSLLQFLLIKGEGNAEDAVIILQQQQGEGWAEV